MTSWDIALAHDDDIEETRRLIDSGQYELKLVVKREHDVASFTLQPDRIAKGAANDLLVELRALMRTGQRYVDALREARRQVGSVEELLRDRIREPMPLNESLLRALRDVVPRR